MTTKPSNMSSTFEKITTTIALLFIVVGGAYLVASCGDKPAGPGTTVQVAPPAQVASAPQIFPEVPQAQPLVPKDTWEAPLPPQAQPKEPVILPPVAAPVKREPVKHASSGEPKASAVATANAARVACLEALVDAKIAADVKANVITDKGNLRDPPNCVAPKAGTLGGITIK